MLWSDFICNLTAKRCTKEDFFTREMKKLQKNNDEESLLNVYRAKKHIAKYKKSVNIDNVPLLLFQFFTYVIKDPCFPL